MKLISVFVYNPTVSTDETTAHENIQAFYPPTWSLDQQMNEVGLCTALVALQDRFSCEVPAMSRSAIGSGSIKGGNGLLGYVESVFSSVFPDEEEKLNGGPSSSNNLASSSSDYNIRQASSSAPPLTQHVRRAFTTGTKRWLVVPIERDFYIAVSVSRGHEGGVEKNNSGSRSSTMSGGSLPSSANARAAKGANAAANDTVPLMPAMEDDADDSCDDAIEAYVWCYYNIFKMMFGSLRMNYSKLVTPLTKAYLRSLPTAAEKDAAKLKREAEMNIFRALVDQGLLAKLVPELRDWLLQPRVDGCSFIAPTGMELLSISGPAALCMSSIIGVLHNAHPGALRGVVAMSEGCVFHSSIGAEDSETLYRLVDYYNNHAPTQGYRAASAAAGSKTRQSMRGPPPNSEATSHHLNVHQSMRAGLNASQSVSGTYPFPSSSNGQGGQMSLGGSPTTKVPTDAKWSDGNTLREVPSTSPTGNAPAEGSDRVRIKKPAVKGSSAEVRNMVILSNYSNTPTGGGGLLGVRGSSSGGMGSTRPITSEDELQSSSPTAMPTDRFDPVRVLATEVTRSSAFRRSNATTSRSRGGNHASRLNPKTGDQKQFSTYDNRPSSFAQPSSGLSSANRLKEYVRSRRSIGAAAWMAVAASGAGGTPNSTNGDSLGPSLPSSYSTQHRKWGGAKASIGSDLEPKGPPLPSAYDFFGSGQLSYASNPLEDEEGSFIFINDAVVGVLTLEVGPIQLLFLVHEKYLMVPQLQHGLKTSIERVLELTNGEQQLAHFVLPSVSSSKAFDHMYLYHYTNAMNQSAKSSIRNVLLADVKERMLAIAIETQGFAGGPSSSGAKGAAGGSMSPEDTGPSSVSHRTAVTQNKKSEKEGKAFESWRQSVRFDKMAEDGARPAWDGGGGMGGPAGSSEDGGGYDLGPFGQKLKRPAPVLMPLRHASHPSVGQMAAIRALMAPEGSVQHRRNGNLATSSRHNGRPGLGKEQRFDNKRKITALSLEVLHGPTGGIARQSEAYAEALGVPSIHDHPFHHSLSSASPTSPGNTTTAPSGSASLGNLLANDAQYPFASMGLQRSCVGTGQRIRSAICRTAARTWCCFVSSEWREFSLILEADSLTEAERALEEVLEMVFVGIFQDVS